MEEKEIPKVLYLYIHFKIWDYFKKEKVSLKDFTSFLFEWRIPKVIRPIIVKEFEVLGLIKKDGRYELKITRPEFNMENYPKYFEELKIY